MLSTQTLEMLADMRQQFAAMLADIGFVSAPKGALSWGRGSKGGGAHWVDDRKAAWNTHSSKPAVVRLEPGQSSVLHVSQVLHVLAVLAMEIQDGKHT